MTLLSSMDFLCPYACKNIALHTDIPSASANINVKLIIFQRLHNTSNKLTAISVLRRCISNNFVLLKA